MSYERLTERFVCWARTCPDIRAAVIVGSRARQDHAADQWSDMDMMVYAANSQRYLSQTDWLENIGTAWITLADTVGKSEPLLRVLFEDGEIVDFFIYPDNYLKTLVKEGVFPRSFHRGAALILDKDGIAKQVIPPYFSPIPLRPPTQEEFLEVINSFWYLALYTAKKLLRGELWLVQVWDAKIKEDVLKILEWHARAHNGWDYDTWYYGHFLEDWASPRAVKELGKTFARYDTADCRRALLATMKLFRGLAKETAQQLDYPYPQKTDDNVSGWIREHLPRVGL
jgi:aminoglycoside 6-adenylyltransferase